MKYILYLKSICSLSCYFLLSLDCPFGYSPCTYGGCVPSNKLCDGHYDCMDHSDEANCGKLRIPIK